MALPLALSDGDKVLCRNVIIYGRSFLDQEGWTEEQQDDFFRRKAVQEEVTRLGRLYQDKQGVQERQKFFDQLDIRKMVPAAMRIMQRALVGEYEDPNTGEKKYPPSAQQVAAAEKILNMSGVNPSLNLAHTELADAPGDDVEDTKEQKHSRDKLRNIADQLKYLIHKKGADPSARRSKVIEVPAITHDASQEEAQAPGPRTPFAPQPEEGAQAARPRKTRVRKKRTG